MINDALPKLAGRLLPSIISHGEDDAVYLTFDDGPDPFITSKICDKLNDLNCPASFFITTSRALSEKLLLVKLFDAGFTIGSHGHQHNSLFMAKFKNVSEDIRMSIQIIEDCTGFRPSLFRPPFGRFSINVMRACSHLNLKLVLWSLSANDWKPSAPRVLSQQIVKRTKHGDIILLHDSGLCAETTLKAIPSIISGLRDRGFNLKALSNTISRHD